MLPRVLLVDDEPEVIAAVQAALKSEPFQIVGANSAKQACELLGQQDFNVVVSDEEMPDTKGAEFLAWAQQHHPTIPRIMLSGRADVRALTRAVNDAEIFKFLAKPVKAQDLALAIKDALRLHQLAHVHREVWSAARRQHAAIASLDGVEATSDSDASSHARVRFAGFQLQRATLSVEPGPPKAPYAERLSTREREIVEAIASGKRVREVAALFSISTHTVRNHLKAIYRKLNVRSQLELLSLIARSANTDVAPG
jgi:two-component system, probable response regulator PhcQ